MKKSIDQIQLIFLVSRGRSGSTLLQSILDVHPQISAPLEAKFILHLATKYKAVSNWDATTVNAFIKDLHTNRKIRLFWNINKEQLHRAFQKYAINSFADACKLVYLHYPSVHPKEDIKVIIDKNPAHSRFIPTLYALFPSAKFIHLVRDYKANIASQMQAFGKKNSYKLAILWTYLNKKIIRSLERVNSTNKHLITYENLVNHPEKEIQRVMFFLGLDYNEKILSGHKALKPLTKTHGYLSLPHHQNVSNPVNTKSIAKWKEVLQPKQIKIINASCYTLANQLNYASTPAKLTRYQSLIYLFTKIRVLTLHTVLCLLFKLPFPIRKIIYNTVSLFFDKKFKK